MEIKDLNNHFGNIDIYLLDQILKDRFPKDMKVLDAGCGEGRNLIYFINNRYQVYGIDRDAKAVNMLRFLAKSKWPQLERERFQVGELDDLPFSNGFFDLIIASAVLHFADSHHHFMAMFDELVRCLQTYGVLFIRMTSDIGLENSVRALGSGRYLIPDGSERFLLTRTLLDQLLSRHSLTFVEPLKTVNVADTRCMTTLVLTKAQ